VRDEGRVQLGGAIPRSRVPEAGGEYSFGLVLVLILASLVFQLATAEAQWSRFVTIILHGAALMAALWAARTHRGLTRLAALAVTVAIAASAVTLIGPGTVEEVPRASSTCCSSR
jgi:hypothetical protein